jgi:hypothetical protein
MPSENGYASAAQLFPGPGSLKRRYRDETLPVSNRRVRIQSLSEGEASRYIAESYKKDGTGVRRDKMVNANGRLISLCLVDQAGNRILGPEHVHRIADEWDAADAEFLFTVCREHCGLGQLGEGEILGKNDSSGTPDDSQPSAAPTDLES